MTDEKAEIVNRIMLACEKRIADAIAAAFAEIRAEVSRMRGASAEEAAKR